MRPHHLRPPVKPYVRISRIRLTDGLLMRHARPPFTNRLAPPVSRHSAGPTMGRRARTPCPGTLGRHEEPVTSGFACLIDGVVGSCDHALTLTPCTGATKAGPLPSAGLLPRRQQYYEPLGLPPGLIPLHRRLIGIASAGRRPPGRTSPVPHWTVPACRPPYPEGVLHRSGLWCSLLPSP